MSMKDDVIAPMLFSTDSGCGALCNWLLLSTCAVV